jgi:hypothetical protein
MTAMATRYTYIFTYRMTPRYWRHQAVTRRFRNQSEADAFADGLRRAGAMDVNYTVQGK